MNKSSIRLALMLTVFSLTFSQLQAQFTTTFAKNVNPGQQSGFYYSLPQTMLQLDFIIEETRCEPGPLRNYAAQYLGSEESIDASSVEYRIVDVRMNRMASPDPYATFFVSVSNGRKKQTDKAFFDIMPNGIIRGVRVGDAVNLEEKMVVDSNIEPQEQSYKAENECLGFMKLQTVGKTDAQLAREASDKITEIRKAKFYLISGDVEMAGNPETFDAMYKRLEEMEQEYVRLFLGIREKKTVVKTVFLTPSKDVATQTVAKFSETEGFSYGVSGNGNSITVQTLPLNSTLSINAPSQSAVESMSYENKLFYRVPETANVRVICDEQILKENRLVVNQLGVLLMAPLSNTNMVFDTETGQIVSMQMQ